MGKKQEAGVNCPLSQALSIFNDELDDIKSATIDNISYSLALIPQPVLTEDENLNWVRQEVYSHLAREAVKTKSFVIKRIVSRQQYVGVVRVVDKVTDIMIDRAKEYPIQDLYDGTLRGGMGKCPFHDDKTASLSFRRYNRFRCFGCDARGSVIDYYMKLHNCSFKEAVRALQ